MHTNHALPRHPIDTELVRVRLDGAPVSATATITRIDDTHANPRARWVEIDKPAYPSAAQVDDLHEASRVVPEPHRCRHEDDALWLDVSMPPNAVAAVAIHLPASGADSGSA